MLTNLVTALFATDPKSNFARMSTVNPVVVLILVWVIARLLWAISLHLAWYISVVLHALVICLICTPMLSSLSACTYHANHSGP